MARTARYLSLGVLVLAALSPLAAGAETAAAESEQTCLRTIQIDRTQIVDKSTILFHMKDGHVWKNTLPQPCSSLMKNDGFAYEPRADVLCDNLEHIHVLRTGQVCMLGVFSPVTPPSK